MECLLSFVLDLVGSDNDHFMLERTKFHKLRLDCKDVKKNSAFRLLKQYVSSLKNNLV